MMEPRLFGDVFPPDDPRPGDTWIANGVYRVRLVDRWDPELLNAYTIPSKYDTSYLKYKEYIKQKRTDNIKRFWENKKKLAETI